MIFLWLLDQEIIIVYKCVYIWETQTFEPHIELNPSYWKIRELERESDFIHEHD